MSDDRPCRFCRAAWGDDADLCMWAHEGHSTDKLEPLATAMASLFQGKNPSDEQIGWFIEAAAAVVDDFDPPPEKWRLRSLPDGDEFAARFRINNVTYVVQDQDKDGANPPVRLSTLRQWQREADAS